MTGDDHVSAAEAALTRAKKTAGDVSPEAATNHLLTAIAHALIACAKKPVGYVR